MTIEQVYVFENLKVNFFNADFQPALPLFQSHTPIYVTTLGTQLCIVYIFSFRVYDAPCAVNIGDDSLNLAQVSFTLVASSTPAPLDRLPTLHCNDCIPSQFFLTKLIHQDYPQTSLGNLIFLKCHYIFYEPNCDTKHK